MQYISRPHHYIGNRRQENSGLGRIGVSGQISRTTPPVDRHLNRSQGGIYIYWVERIGLGGVGQFYRASLKHINKDALPHIKYYRHVFAASIYGTPATKCEMADHPRRKDLLQRIGVPGCPVHRAGVPCLAILLIPAVLRARVIT